MRLQPGDNLAMAISRAQGEQIILGAGAYTGGAVYGCRYPIHLTGEGIVVITGGKGLKLVDCAFVRLEELDISGSLSHGLMVTGCEGLQARWLTIQRSDGSNILTANTSYVDIAECLLEGAVKGHGIYLSQSGDNYRIADNICRGNARCGIQVNANQSKRRPKQPDRDGVSHKVKIFSNTLEGNQRFNAAALNLAACQEVELRDNYVIEHQGRHGFAFWDDGTGDAKLACHDVLVRDNRFQFTSGKGTACISVGENCTEIVVGRDNVFDSRVKAVEGPHTLV